MGRRGWVVIYSSPMPLGGQPTYRRLQLQRFSQRSGCPAPWRWAPRTLALKTNGAYFWESQRVGRNRDFTLRVHLKSHKLQDLGQKQQFDRSLRQTYLLILEILQEKQEETAAHPGDIDTGGSHFGEFLLWRGHWCWEMLFWNPPSIGNLLAPVPISALALQTIGTSAGTPQAKQLYTDIVLPPSVRAALRATEPTFVPGHGPAQERAQDWDPHTSVQTLDSRPLGLSRKRPWDTAPPTSGQAPAP